MCHLRRAGQMIRASGALVTEVILPPVCSGCGVGGAWLCARCAEWERRLDRDPGCRRCGRPLDSPRASCERCADWPRSIDMARSAYRFDGAIRTMIHQLKYERQRARATWCGEALADVVSPMRWAIDVVVPVPLHRAKERARGFNQSRLIADELANRLGLEMAELLVRSRSTRSQVDLTAEERRANVRGAFAARRRMDGIVVLLVDDVLTTGATLVECGVACRAAGADKVVAVTVATA